MFLKKLELVEKNFVPGNQWFPKFFDLWLKCLLKHWLQFIVLNKSRIFYKKQSFRIIIWIKSFF